MKYSGKKLEEMTGVPLRTIQYWSTAGEIGKKIIVPLGHGFYWQYDESDLKYLQEKARIKKEKNKKYF